MPTRLSFALIPAIALAAFGGCSHRPASEGPVPVEQTGTTAPGTLERRADSLIVRLLDTPGAFWSDGHIYTFRTDQAVLDNLTALEMHAVPQLIECMGDDRPSRVTYRDPETERTKKALRGAICFQALVDTHFWMMKDDTLFQRVESSVPCETHDASHGDDCDSGYFLGYQAKAQELRREQRILRAYLAAYRSAGRPVLPRLGQTAVGCYSLVLRPNHPGALAVDTTRRLTFELDTLPLPCTVRPTALRLSESLTIGGAASWRPYYENRVLVSWGDPKRGGYLGMNFGGSDSALAGYQLVRSNADVHETFGKVEVTRVPCSSAPSAR